MAIKKTCRHGRGLAPEQRLRAWNRCSCNWYADLYVDGARQVVSVGKDRLAARAEYHRLLGDTLAGRLHVVPEQTGLRFHEACERWIERSETEGARPSTLTCYRSRNVRLRDYFGDVPVSTISAQDVEAFVKETRKIRSAGYTRDLHTQLQSILRMAEGESRRLRLRRDEQEQLGLAAAERVIALLEAPFAQMAELALLTSLRLGELLGLEAADINGGILWVARQVGKDHKVGPPKSESSRRGVVLSTRAREIVEAVIAERPSGRLFPVSYYVAQVRLRAAMEQAGVYKPRRGWHSFRREHGTLANRAGHSLRDTAAQMGHGNNLSQTMKYGAAAPVDADALDRARRALGEA